ncbi:MAG: L-threonylcarbamoyladenylate synthase, partial [Casimicrobiaceae bacterium]
MSDRVRPATGDADAVIDEAARLLAAGELVAFPTETVYGLGADASNPLALVRLFKAKQRPSDHPVIVHVSDLAAALPWSSSMPDGARALAERFWPGPLTLVVPRSPRVP